MELEPDRLIQLSLSPLCIGVKGICVVSGYRPHLKDRLRDAFDRGVRPEILVRLVTDDQRRQATKTVEQAIELRHKAREDHYEKYDVRVKHMMAKVRDEWTRPSAQLKPYFSYRDTLDPTDLRLEAEKRVRRRFEQVLARIDSAERRQMNRIAGLPERRFQERAPRIAAQEKEHELVLAREELRPAFARARERKR